MTEETRKKYVVFKANIMDDEGNKRKHGDVVELTPETARHYNKRGFLRPYFEEEDETDGEPDPVGDKTPELARSRRPAAQPSGS
jgi:hypothetical protein